MTEGRLFIISAPSGAGKTSLVQELLRRDEQFAVSISHTTRPPRDGERHAVDYYFTSDAEFDSLIADEALVEYASVFGHRYGTSGEEIARLHAEGRDVILEIDWQGARTVRARLPEALSIFILPPSLAALKLRLQQRGTDDPEVIQTRLAQARSDILNCAEFDHCVINDIFDEAIDRLQHLLQHPEQIDEDPRPCFERVLEMQAPPK